MKKMNSTKLTENKRDLEMLKNEEKRLCDIEKYREERFIQKRDEL